MRAVFVSRIGIFVCGPAIYVSITRPESDLPSTCKRHVMRSDCSMLFRRNKFLPAAAANSSNQSTCYYIDLDLTFSISN